LQICEGLDLAHFSPDVLVGFVLELGSQDGDDADSDEHREANH